MVNCYGIEMDTKLKVLIDKRLEFIQDQCPSNSRIKLKFKRKGTFFIGEISIKSFPLWIKSQKLGPDPIQALQLIEQDVIEQLTEWKRNRFSKKVENALFSTTNFKRPLF